MKDQPPSRRIKVSRRGERVYVLGIFREYFFS
jgi:hypothetical protein